MAISHTELTSYFDDVLGEVKSILSITTYNDTITRILWDYGIDADFNSSDATLNTLLLTASDKSKLVAIALMHVWKFALGLSTSRYKFSADGGSYDRQQLYDHCKENYKLALNDAISYLSGFDATFLDATPTQNAFSYNVNRLED